MTNDEFHEVIDLARKDLTNEQSDVYVFLEELQGRESICNVKMEILCNCCWVEGGDAKAVRWEYNSKVYVTEGTRLWEGGNQIDPYIVFPPTYQIAD